MADLTVTEGDVVEVTRDVTNTGDQAGSKDVELDVDGTVEDEEANFQLDAGETATISLYWGTEAGDAGTDIPVTFQTPDDSVQITVTVNSP